MTKFDNTFRKKYHKNNHQQYHIWCWWVGGNIGWETGEQFADRMIRSASRKFRNRLATSKSCLNSLWKRSAEQNNDQCKTKKIPKLHAESLEMLKKYHVNLASQQKDRESWDLPWGRTFQAIVSVTAVKIQFNSPRSVFRSFGRPGILSISELTSDSRSNERVQNLETNYITKLNSHFTMRYALISYHNLKVQVL